MSKKLKLVLGVTAAAGLMAIFIRYLSNISIPILQPAGIVAQKEKNLIIIALLLCMIVVLPVFIMTFYIAWKYRESNTSGAYQPTWDHNWKIETVWWGVPLFIIVILGIITWKSSHDLDPARELSSSIPSLQVQVVALPWKWLFIYPRQKIASVNYLEIPVNTPVVFTVTADAPLNSFWVPQLGGQVYAMSGMNTTLNLMADKPGTFVGRSANVSGRGFAGMTFKVKATSTDDFSEWIEKVKQSPDKLSYAKYSELAAPSSNNPISYYSANAYQLYESVIMKYRQPGFQMGNNPSNYAIMSDKIN